MGITAVSNNTTYANPVQNTAPSDHQAANSEDISTQPIVTSSTQSVSQASPETQQKQKEAKKDDLTKHTDEMNQIMEALDTHLRFSLHEKTKRLMVQLVDLRDNKVLKEFPPHEFLDTIAKIRDFVGFILDKKA